MRVALVQHPSITMDLSHTGGVEVAELNELRHLHDRGVEAHLYVARLLGQNPHIHEIRDIHWQNRYLQMFYYWQFQQAEPLADVYHGHFTPALGVWAPDRAVVHYHGPIHSILPFRCLLRSSYRRVHYVFCARWLQQRFHGLYPDIPEKHLHTVYCGSDHVSLDPKLAACRPNRPPRIIFYGGWIPSKGIFELLEAIRLLEQKRTDFEVHFGGSAFSHYKRADSQEIDKRVRALSQALRTVRLIGHIDQSALTGLLSTMDIGVFPSVYEEPFGMVVTEMMAAGLPVVAFAVGGPRESIVDGETGLLVQNKNVQALARALEKLIDDEQLRLAMGERARKRVEQYFTWDRHVDQLLEIYEQITKRNRDRKR